MLGLRLRDLGDASFARASPSVTGFLRNRRLRRRRRPSGLDSSYAVALQFFVQGAKADAEALGSFAPVAVDRRERLLDCGALDVVERVGFGRSALRFAAARADEAGNGIEIAYAVPQEGALQWFDMMAIPADAPNPEGALAWINFIMEPQITADITNYVWYASANKEAMPLIDPEIKDDPAIFPPPEVVAKLFPAVVYDARTERTLTRLWTTVRTGQ